MLNGWIILGIIVWLYGLSVLKRGNLSGVYFWWGSIGLFIITAFIFRPYFVWLISYLLTNTLGLFAKMTHWFSVYPVSNFLQIGDGKTSVQLFVDYECSGVIEFLAYVSLVAFYPLYDRQARIVAGLIGSVWIFAANIIRLLFIVAVVKACGGRALFWAHSVFGRLLFYTLVIILYYNIFTRPQMVNGLNQRFLRRDDRATNG